MTRPDYSMITKQKPEKTLLVPLVKRAGRNNQGKITVRHQGGGVKRMYRLIEFGERKLGISAKVLSIEYDPNRSARIALIEYEDRERVYIIAPQDLAIGSSLLCSEKAPLLVGNRMKVKNIPIGTFVYNVELNPGSAGKIARSAGSACKILATEGKYTTLSLPSGETRKVIAECFASIGSVSNPQHNLARIGKAGRMRHMGKRPEVRGKAMNARDHPHGHGGGRSTIGLKYPKTPWGKHALGVRTRNKKKYSRMFILQRRK